MFQLKNLEMILTLLVKFENKDNKKNIIEEIKNNLDSILLGVIMTLEELKMLVQKLVLNYLNLV